MLPGFSSRGHKVLKKLFKEFQDSYAWSSLISEWNDLSNSGSLFSLDASLLVSAQEDVWFGRRYCLKYSKTGAMVAQQDSSAGCESTIPCLMPYKLSHCILQICR